MTYDKRITDLAAIAAQAAAKNAEVAPQLLVADITFALADAVEDGRIALGSDVSASAPEHRGYAAALPHIRAAISAFRGAR